MKSLQSDGVLQLPFPAQPPGSEIMTRGYYFIMFVFSKSSRVPGTQQALKTFLEFIESEKSAE